MKKVIFYLALVLLGLVYLIAQDAQGLLPEWLKAHQLAFRSVLAGGFGGFTYCARAVYLNACVKKNWDVDWEPWYYIRPIVSLVTGGAGYVFLRAGLLVLDSSKPSDSSNLGFLALSFIAGLNVDRFVQRIEGLGKTIWGIEESRAAKPEAESKGKGGKNAKV